MEGLCAVCGGLGAYKTDDDGNDRYVKGEECLENLMDLQRYLRRDNPETRDIFFELGKWNIVRHDLVPLIRGYRADDELVLNAVKVVVFLTMPTDPTSNNVPLQLEYLRGFKDAFLEQDAIGVIVTHLEKPLEHLDSGSTTEDDWKLVQLMLTLFRNLLCICDPPHQQQITASSPQLQYLKDELLERLFRENVLDILLALVQHVGGSRSFLRHDNLLMVEIIHYIFWGQQPGTLASAEKLKKQVSSSSALLLALREKEKEQCRKRNALKGCRPARFEGTYTQVGQDGSTGMLRDPFQSPLESMARRPQVRRGPVKKVAEDVQHFPTQNTCLLAHLKDLADQFLSSGYNILMQAVKEDIRKERSGLQSADILTFFRVAEFFTTYHHAKQTSMQKQLQAKNPSGEGSVPPNAEQCGPIAATMDENMFTLVISKWNEYAESAKDSSAWKSVNTAGSLLKCMIRVLDNILKTASSDTKQGQREIRVARILLYKVFYDQTESGILSFLLQLVKSFDIHKQPRRHLTDLVETTHVVLRLLESLTEEEGALRVITKARKHGKRGKNQGEQVHEDAPSLSGEDQQNARAEDQQQESGSENQHTEQAAGQAAEVDLRDVPSDTSNEVAGQQLGTTAAVVDPGETLDDEEPKVKEVSLDMKKFAARFADNAVIRNYCWLLKHYKDNSPATNYYILRMLQRICNDHALEPLLYQVSVLRIFHDILSDAMVQRAEEHRPLREFLTKVVRNVFKKLKSQPILFVELLFWKTRGECHNITVDHMLNRIGQDKRSLKRGGDTYDALGDDEADAVPDAPSSRKRREALEDALGEDEHGEGCAESLNPSKRSLGDALGDDEGDIVAGVGTDAEVNTCVKDTAGGSRKSKPVRRKGRSGPFTEEQEEHIKQLYEKFKGKRGCLKLIAQALGPEEASFSSAQVGRKLKQLGLGRDSKAGKTGDELENDDSIPQLRKRRRLLDHRSLDAIKNLSAEDDDLSLSDTRPPRSIARGSNNIDQDHEDDSAPLSNWLGTTTLEVEARDTTTQRGASPSAKTTSGREHQSVPLTESIEDWADEPTEICPSLRSVLTRRRRKSPASGPETVPCGSPPDISAGPPSPVDSAAPGNVSTTAETDVTVSGLPKRRRLAKKQQEQSAGIDPAAEAGDDIDAIYGGRNSVSELKQGRRTIVMTDDCD